MEVVTANDFPFGLHPRQRDAFQSLANELFYGGAKGGGKSFLLRYCLIWWALEIPGLQEFLFRKHYKELMANHMEGPTGFKAMLSRLIKKKKCSIVGKEIRFANGSMIYLNHLQHEKDLMQWQGVEQHVLAIDQLEQFSDASYRFLRANLRKPDSLILPPHINPAMFPRIIASGNPGGISHQFVKDTFVGTSEENRAFKLIRQSAIPNEEGISEGGMLRQFIPARLEDNPALQNDPTYRDRLRGLGNPELVRALLEGDWDVVAGSMFGYVFRKHRHICDPFPIPATWDVWHGGDDGFAAPAAVYEMTQDPDTGTFYVIDEIYGTGYLPNVLAEKMLKMDRNVQIDLGDGTIVDNDMELRGPYDSAAFSDIGTGNKSRGAQMNERGCQLRPVEKGPGSRVMRCQMLHQVLAPNPNNRKDRDGIPYPGLMFFPKCTKAIETIPQLPISKHNPEDVDDAAEDHAFDGVTYLLTEKASWFKKLRVNYR